MERSVSRKETNPKNALSGSHPHMDDKVGQYKHVTTSHKSTYMDGQLCTFELKPRSNLLQVWASFAILVHAI